MTQNIADVVRAVQDLIDRGIVSNYAIGGAIGGLFWDEVISTFDLDIFVMLTDQKGLLIDLGPIYAWATERGFPQSKEHITISGIPVQLVPAPNPLSEEAIAQAAEIQLDGTTIRVMRPEYLIAMWLTPPANTGNRKERAAKLRQSPHVDEGRLDELLKRYALSW